METELLDPKIREFFKFLVHITKLLVQDYKNLHFYQPCLTSRRFTNRGYCNFLNFQQSVGLNIITHLFTCFPFLGSWTFDYLFEFFMFILLVLVFHLSWFVPVLLITLNLRWRSLPMAGSIGSAFLRFPFFQLLEIRKYRKI